MIGHRRRRGHSALASAASAHILPRQRRRVRSLPVDRAERGNQLGASAPWGESGLVPGSADRPCEPVSSPRRPTTDPWTRPSAYLHACPPWPARPSRRPPRPPRSASRAALSIRPPLERRARGGRSAASPTGRCDRRDPPRQHRAGFAVRRRPARVTPQRGGGGGRAAPRRVGDLPHGLPRARDRGARFGRRTGRPAPEPDGPGRGQLSAPGTRSPRAALPHAQLIRCASCGS
jgi:hypothetical protein